MKKRHLFSFCHLSQQTPAVSEVTQNQSESEFQTQGALMQHKELKLGSVLLSEGKSQAAFCQNPLPVYLGHTSLPGEVLACPTSWPRLCTCHLSPPVTNACQCHLWGSTGHHCLSPGWPCSLLLGFLDAPQPLLEFPMLLSGHGPFPPPPLCRPHFKPPVKPQGFPFFQQVMLPFTSAPLHRCSSYLEHPSSAAPHLKVIDELTVIPPLSLSFGNPVVFIRTKVYYTEWS